MRGKCEKTVIKETEFIVCLCLPWSG